VRRAGLNIPDRHPGNEKISYPAIIPGFIEKYYTQEDKIFIDHDLLLACADMTARGFLEECLVKLSFKNHHIRRRITSVER
jgi:hypothetical protein